MLEEMFKPCVDVLQHYSCPEDCNFCCETSEISFGSAEYKKISTKPKLKRILQTKTKVETETIRGIPVNEYVFNTKPCPFLKKKKCSIQDVKPLVCRVYPFTVGKCNIKGFISIDPCPLGVKVMLDYTICSLMAVMTNDTLNDEEKSEEEFKILDNLKWIFGKVKDVGEKETGPLMHIHLSNVSVFDKFLTFAPVELLIEKRQNILDVINCNDIIKSWVM